MWRREVLVVSAALPAAVNLFSNVFVIRYLGLEQFGIWLIWRTGCQLTSNIGPGFGVALSVLLPSYHWRKERAACVHRLAQKYAFWWGCGATLLAAIFIYIFVDTSLLLCFSLVLFWAGLYFSGFTGVVSRGYRDGWSILRGSLADAGGAILSIVAAYYGDFFLFVTLQALRMWVKGFLQYTSPATEEINDAKDIPANIYLKKILSTGFPLVVRGWVQTALQYGDRFLIGSLFGPVVGGIAGMGSMLAMPTVIVASSSAAWLLPVMLTETKKDSGPSVVKEISLLLTFVAVFAFYIPILIFFVPVVSEKIQLVSIVYFEVCLLSIVAPVLSSIVAQGKFWHAVYVNTVVALIVVIFLISSFLGLFDLELAFWGIILFVSLFVVYTLSHSLDLNVVFKLIIVILSYFIFSVVFVNSVEYLCSNFVFSILIATFLTAFVFVRFWLKAK